MQSCSFVYCVCGYETWSLKLRDEHKLRVFENRVLRNLFGSKTEEVAGNGGDCTVRSFMISTLQ